MQASTVLQDMHNREHGSIFKVLHFITNQKKK